MKRKAEIKIVKLNSIEYPFAVDFWGFNEGSGTPCENEKEIKEQVDYLLKTYSGVYELEIIDERIKCVQKTL